MQAGDPIRTYRVRRRSGPARVALLERLRPTFALELHELAPTGGFGPEIVEIGCGAGEATLALAEADARPLLAVEVHTPGVATLLAGLEQRGLTHVRVHEGDGREVLAHLAPRCLSEVRVFFPDPWPKSRHAKRRLVTPAFLALVAGRLRSGGRLHVATDWPPYAEQVRSAVEASPDLAVLSDARGDRPLTRFERRGLAAGRAAEDLLAVRR